MSKRNKIIDEIGDKMRMNKFTLVTAESCTGGGLAFAITTNPKISFMLERGYITYSNQSKQDLLYVKPITLQTKGAVSKAVVEEMARGALHNSCAQISLAITGIAGYDEVKDANINKNGIVWICCLAVNRKPLINKFLIQGSRKVFCDKVIKESLLQLKKYISKLK